MNEEQFTYITEASIIPMGMKWRAGINDPAVVSPQRTMGDPGAAMAQAFVKALDRKPPKVDIPNPKMSKQGQYWRDVLDNMAPIPTFGVPDDRPETDGELQAKYNPQPINEPAPVTGIPNDFQFSQSGKWVGDTELIDIPINGLPNITM